MRTFLFWDFNLTLQITTLNEIDFLFERLNLKPKQTIQSFS